MSNDITFHYTPEELAKKLIGLVALDEGDTLLEPFKGKGAFYNNFPTGHDKQWCEIDEGRDFFTYDQQCDVIITNPPFKIEGQKQGLILCMDKCFSVAQKKVCLLYNSKCFNSMTPLRLERWSGQGWNITKIHICNVKKWFGRYYFVIFEKNKESIIGYDTENY